MAEVLYSADCDGTIIIPTAGCVILVDYDNSTGHLKLLHRDGTSHSTFPMNQKNDIWYHTFNSMYKPLATIIRTNDAYLSALWYGRFGCAGISVIDTIHKYGKCINQTLRRNRYYKFPPCLPNKICKRSMKRNETTRTAKHKVRSSPRMKTLIHQKVRNIVS